MITFTPQYIFKNDINVNTENKDPSVICAKLCSLPNDTFIKTKKSNVSFGHIPQDETFKLCSELLENFKNPKKHLDDLLEVFKNTFINIAMNKPEDANLIEKKAWRHEIINIINNKGITILTLFDDGLLDTKFDKNMLVNELVDGVRKSTIRWNKTEYNINKTSNVKAVFDDLKGLAKSLNSPAIEFRNLDMIEEKTLKNPDLAYTILSQPLLNAVKYGEGKPIQIAVETVENGGKSSYCLSFTNTETKPISDEEIEKILEGKKYRSKSAKESGIDGSGEGFSFIIDILKENNFHDITNLIEKGREKGVCVRIPLFGIE